MTITPATSLRELAFVVCTALHEAGETAVLSGGGAATIYSAGAYESRDLDFLWALHSVIAPVSNAPLLALGFVRSGAGYRHPDSPYTLEFPPGPLTIGNQVITEWDTLRDGEQVLHILSPTDCVRDRLVGFLHGNDYNGLSQAVLVAKSQTIHLAVIERWCLEEGKSGKFAMFNHRLERAMDLIAPPEF